MADTKISALSAASSALGADELHALRWFLDDRLEV